MIVPASIRRRWEKDQHALEIIERVVWETISNYSKRKNGFAVTARPKDVHSIAEKLETGRYKRWSELDDLYACKIIVPTLADEPETIEFLKSVFEMVRIASRGTTIKSPEIFRFDSTRFIGRLRETGDPDRDQARKVSFEVQVVTAFEHAWSTTTHALAYKSGELDWRTKRVASQLRAAVEQMDMIVLGATEAAELLTPSRYPILEEQQKLLEGFRSLISKGVIPDELEPAKWSRFAENIHLLFGDRRKPLGNPGPTELIHECSVRASKFDRAFPRLLSLHQFVLGCGLEAGIFTLPINRHTPLLTDELRQVFPSLEKVSGGFELEE